MSNELVERVVHSLNSLPCVEVVESGGDQYHVQALCRVDKKKLNQWASIAEALLLAQDDEGDIWSTHISRIYMLKNRRLVYGWMVVFTSEILEEIIPIVVKVIRGFIPTRSDTVPAGKTSEASSNAPAVRRAAPNPDAKGYPQVPEGQKVWEQPMAGLPQDFDRNAPADGRGAYGLYRSNTLGDAFKPPPGSGRVGGS